ncbi:MAG: PilZ domain-containing protein [Thermodesulfobacteriota bacterium]
MPVQKRSACRYRNIANKDVLIRFDEKIFIEAKIQDISVAGICLDTSPSNQENCFNSEINQQGEILFRVNQQSPLKTKFKIVRNEKKGRWLGCRFDNILNSLDLNKIRGNDECSYDLCKLDKDIVLKEAQQIKICSSNYFIWTMGLLVPLISGVWTLTLQGTIDAPSCSGAMLAIFLVYCMSVFSNLEKSRAIYKREAFAAALDNYLMLGLSPPNYKGWPNLKYNYAECTSKRDAGVCPRELDKNSNKACKFIGEKKAQINEFKRVVPSILDSFISLTSVFYFFLYTIIIILSAISIAMLFSSDNYLVEYGRIIFYFTFGFILGFFFLGRNARILLVVIFVTIIVFTIGAVNPTASLPIGNYTINNFYIVLVSASFGYILGSIGNILVSQLIKLRKKQYSFESQFYMWLYIFENCVLIPDYEIKEDTNKNILSKFIESLSDAIFFGKVPSIKRS